MHNGFNASEHMVGLDEPSMGQPVVMAWGTHLPRSASCRFTLPEAGSRISHLNSHRTAKLHMPQSRWM